eukprot:6098390-Ditylum_brightwellii.AAC.1
MGHPHPDTTIHCNNSTAVGIANQTIKQQCSRSMNMHFFLILHQIQQDNFSSKWHPGQETLADYPTKNHPAAHHS